MTDKQIILDMIKRATVDGLKKNSGRFKGADSLSSFYIEKDKNSVTVYSGYSGFCTSFEFDKDGNLIFIGAYE
jgi:hypothetical protein